MACPPEAAPSLTTAKGENRLWPDRLSSCTTNEALPPELLLEVEEVLDDDVLLELELLLPEPVPKLM
jgi:hypothetical protein